MYFKNFKQQNVRPGTVPYLNAINAVVVNERIKHMKLTQMKIILLKFENTRYSRYEICITHRHLKWMSDELHLTLRRNGKACYETSNARRRWPYFQTPMSFKPVYKIRILPQRLQTILHISTYIILHCTIFITSWHITDDLYRRQMLKI